MQQWRHVVPYYALSAILFYVSIILLSRWSIVPSPETLIALLQSWYATYGWWALFVSSVIETIVYVGLYFPGSVIIGTMVVLSGGGGVVLGQVALVVGAATIVGCGVSYVIGHMRVILSSAREPTQPALTWRSFLLVHLHPNAVALWYARAGWHGQAFWRYLPLTFMITVIWSWTFWMTISQFVVSPATRFDEGTVVVVALGLWVLLETAIKYYRLSRH